MVLYFPGIASLCQEVDAQWHAEATVKPRMDFGLFYSMAINVDMGEQVKSIPHHNVMNLAFGVCAIMAFGTLCILSTNLVADIIFDAGFFPDGIIVWLVNHKAKIVIQIPSTVFYFCLSSIITHYNLDTHGAFRGQSV